MRKSKRVVVALLLCVLPAAIGCSGKPKDQPELGKVTGRVTLDGEPVPNVAVHFMPIGGRSSIGITDQDGKFVMAYLPKIFGAKVGKHKVAIKTHYNDETDPEAQMGIEKIPKRYNGDTELTAEVKPGDNVINFDLKSD